MTLEHELRVMEANGHKGKVLDSRKPPSPKLPAFDDVKYDIDSYLMRFERYAVAQKWAEESWATNLSALLKGRALDVYALLPSEKALDYPSLKEALLKRYDLTDDGFMHKFRSARPETGETFAQFRVRLGSYFIRWLDMSDVGSSFEDLFDLMLRDQFFHVCNRDLKLFLKERIPKSSEDMAGLADQYREARVVSAVSLSVRNQPVVQGQGSSQVRTTAAPQKAVDSKPYGDRPLGKQTGPRDDRRCYKCGRHGHIARDCHADTTQGRSPRVNSVMTNNNAYGPGPVDNNSYNRYGCPPPQVCGACVLPSESVVVSVPTNTSTKVSSSYREGPKISMPVSTGYVEGKEVSVLRDTGCSGVVVRQNLVNQECMTGSFQTCILADGTSVQAPVARICIDTPYLQGSVEAWCMQSPVYDLILGNVGNVREPGDPDVEWKPVGAVETRQQVRDKGKPYKALKVPEIVSGEVSPEDIRKAQQQDPTLVKIRQYVQLGETTLRHKGKVRWLMRNGLIHREYITDAGGSEKVFMQLVVPEQFRDTVTKLAHESIMSGHLATSRTVSRVLSEFYWPGIQADIKRFCRSCDICQRTVAKGRITKVPLQTMPLIDEPFKRVGVDLVGPLHPITDKGNRYILTLVDYATRYPEAVALPSIETERVAEALVDMFSRIGIPREMLTDMGSQFTSSLMAEVSRLISLRQLTTTPYNPACNGLCEKFNGTLKQMLKRMAAERPKDWDKYLNALLFAYREVPQESLGFSPFELVYGRTVRGPMTILKELWTKEIDNVEVKTTYQYVVDLRDRLESTCELARENLERASKRYKTVYNRKARERNMQVGEKVLVLLPTDNNKLLMQWKGPFSIVKKVGKVDYQIDMAGKLKTFHANLLKLYVERSGQSQPQESKESGRGLGDNAFAVVSIAVIDMAQGEDADVPEMDGEILDIPDVNADEGPSDVDVNPELTDEQAQQVRSLLEEFSDVLTDKPGRTNILDHDIRTVSSEPVRVKPYPLPYAMTETVNKEVEKMIDLNIIEPSESPYCSPFVIIKKKDSTNRFCIDFRSLNRNTVFDAEPMPNAEEIFSKLACHRFYSRLDLSKGYWQVPLTESAKAKTAFQTPKGLYQFLTMPFGLVTAPATFSRLMRKLLKDMQNIDNFIDDVIIFTMTFAEHMQVLRELFSRLRQANLTARPSKCALMFGKLECLGHFVGEEQLSPHPSKVQAIKDATRPVTKKQVRSFLGLVGFYRKFVPNFALIALPLTDMTRKGMPNHVVWGDAQENAFQTLKEALARSPILKLPDLSAQFILQTDASDRGLGGVLLQKENGKNMPIAYASRKLKKAEIGYATIEKECLAIVWAIQKFHRYLYGQEFELETDHKPLMYLNRAKVANARLMRWALTLQPYRFRIVAIKGKDNVGADYFSRV